MDGERFDELARLFAARTTRRRTLRALVAGAAAAAGLSATRRAGALCDPDTGPQECSSDEECPSPDACHVGFCEFIPGGCFACRVAPRVNGSPCDDGNRCTAGTCQSGVCQSGPPIACPPPPDQCHGAGTCNPFTGLCDYPPLTGTPCNDGNACTQTDVCINGACVGQNPVVCTPLDVCHDVGTCDPATGQCSNPAKPDGTACGDGNACNGDETCVGGVCSGGAPLQCTTTNPCMDAVCDPAAGCVETPKPAGTACPDADLCNGTEVCDGAGNCVAGTAPATCGACLICDPSTGTCTADPAQEGEACPGDGNRCFGAHVCQGGACVGVQPVVCTAGDACHSAGTCDPATGQCSNPAAPNGSACSDGNACTTGDTCQNGVCTGGPSVVCPPPGVCKVSTGCDPASGSCGEANAPDGTSCGTNGGCVGGACVTCGKRTEFCGGICRGKSSYNQDDRNCGACGHICPPNTICKGGFCTAVAKKK